MGLDTRQIQTAVLGSAESDDPVVCPTDALDLDAFRREYQSRTFWCGLLLGGCGGQLGTRRCSDRVCHFYHLASLDGLPSACGRRGRGAGAASADHLYVKAATEGWLRRQGRAPRYRLTQHHDARCDGQDMLGSLVDISGAGLRLRFHLDASVPPDWDAGGAPEPILGPGVPIAAAVWARRRYVNRFTFSSDGSRRVLRFGTQTPQGTDWFAPAQCTIAPDGTLITPAVERIRATAPHPLPAPDPAFPPAAPALDGPQPPATDPATGTVPPQVGTVIRRLNTAVNTQSTPEVRNLLRHAEAQTDRCVGLALDRLGAAVRAAKIWLDRQDTLRQLVFTRLEDAIRVRRPGEAQALLQQAHRLLDRGETPTRAEAALLAEARRLTLTAPVALPPRPPQGPPRRLSRKEAERVRRAAADDARHLLNRLRCQPGMSPGRQRALIGELSRVVAAAGGELTAEEHRAAADWAYKASTGRAAPRPPTAAAPSPPSQPAPLFLPPEAGPSRPRRPGHAPVDDDERRAAALVAAAAAVRGALKKAAREQTTTSWSRLRRQLGSALPRMGPADQVEVLTLADRDTPADQPLFTALLVSGDPSVIGHYRAAAGKLGRSVPGDNAALRAQLAADVQRLHDHWRHR